MRHSSLFFIPSPSGNSDAATTTFKSLAAHIESHPEATLSLDTPPFILSYRLFRSTPATTSSQSLTQAPPSLHHIFHLSTLDPNRSYCYIQRLPGPGAPADVNGQPCVPPTINGHIEPLMADPPKPKPSTIISIPFKQTDRHINFLAGPMFALWSARHAFKNAHGIVYTVGEYDIQLVLLASQRLEATPGSTYSPGVVLCISFDAEDVDEEEFDEEGEMAKTLAEDGAKVIKGVWKDVTRGVKMHRSDVREVNVGVEGMRMETEKHAVVKMWCAALSVRG